MWFLRRLPALGTTLLALLAVASCAPSPGSAPDATPADTSVPDSATPDTTVPDATATPDTSVPDATVPDATATPDGPVDGTVDPPDAGTDAPSMDLPADRSADTVDTSFVDAPDDRLPPPVDRPPPVDLPPERVDAGAPDTTPADLGPSRGAPTIRITAPAAGAVLTSPTTLTLQFTAPDGFGRIELLRDGVLQGVFETPTLAITVHPASAPAGAHTLAARIVDARGASATATLDVTFRAPDFAPLSIDADAFEYRNGDEVVLDARYRGTGFVLRGDFSALDSDYSSGRVTVTDRGGGAFTIRYRISTANRRPDGSYLAVLVATGRGTMDSVRSTVEVRLANTPRMPFVLRDASFTEGSAAPPREPPSSSLPRIDSLSGDTLLPTGASGTLTASWVARPGVAVTALRVSVDGTAGYWTLPVTDPRATRATITLTVPDDLAVTSPTSYTLRVRALDAGFTLGPSTALALRVVPLGRGGGAFRVTLRGQVRFRKRIVGTTAPCGLEAAPYDSLHWLIVPAQVEVVRGATVLATGTTNGAGNYRLSFDSRGESVRVRVTARLGTAPMTDVQVTDHGGMVHTHTSAPVTPMAAGELVHRVDITDASAGAFAILRTLGEARSASIALHGGTLPPLTAQWQSGTAFACGSCYDRMQTLSIGGGAADPDEWDDPVLRHEFGHFVMGQRSRDDSPGGAHGINTPSDPRVALSEGFASFWGAVLVGNACYYDGTAGGGLSYPIDTTDPMVITLNTTPADDPTGRLSEAVVSGTLWKLWNAPWATPPLDPTAAVAWTFFTWFPAATWADAAGSSAGTDLVDALHGWLCADSCHDAEMRNIVVGSYLFNYLNPSAWAHCPAPYDMPAAPRCIGTSALVLTTSGLARASIAGATITRDAIAGSAGGLLALGTTPRAIALVRPGGAGPTRAVVSNFGNDTVSLVSVIAGQEREVDADDNAMTTSAGAPAGITRITVGNGPRGVAVSPEGRYALVAISGADQLAVVDIDRRAVCERVPLPRPATERAGASVPDSVAILPDGSRAYVSLAGSASNPGESVVVLDMARLRDCTAAPTAILRYITGLGGMPRPTPLAVNPAGSRLAVGGAGNNLVKIVDTATDTVVDLYPFIPFRDSLQAAQVPTALAWTRSGDRLFYGHISAPAGTRLDPAGTVRFATFPDAEVSRDVGIMGSVFSLAVASDGSFAYAGSSTGGLTALPATHWDVVGMPFGERAGGCLDGMNRSTPCPTTLSLGTSAVRGIVLVR